MKMALVLVLVMLAFSVFSPQSSALVLEMSEEQIKEAVEYGKKNKDLPIQEFEKEWTTSEEGQWAVIYTPYHIIALSAKFAALGGRELSKEEISEKLQLIEGFWFMVIINQNLFPRRLISINQSKKIKRDTYLRVSGDGARKILQQPHSNPKFTRDAFYPIFQDPTAIDGHYLSLFIGGFPTRSIPKKAIIELVCPTLPTMNVAIRARVKGEKREGEIKIRKTSLIFIFNLLKMEIK